MTFQQSTIVRSCVQCRKRENPIGLIRTVYRDGKIIPDQKGISPGRGAWVHRSCVARAIERKAFGRAFRLDARLESSLDTSELFAYVQEND